MSQMQEQLLLSKHIFFTSLTCWYSIVCGENEKCDLSGSYYRKNRKDIVQWMRISVLIRKVGTPMRCTGKS